MGMKTLLILLFLFEGLSSFAQVYNSEAGDQISLLNDSTIQFYFRTVGITCEASYIKNEKEIDVEFKIVNFEIDTLNSDSCQGFFMDERNSTPILLYDGKEVYQDDSYSYFIPYIFASDSITFVLLFVEEEIRYYPVVGLKKGCYSILCQMNTCDFMYTPYFRKIQVKRRGKILLVNGYKYKRVKN